MSVKTGKQFTRDEFLSVCEEFKGTGRKKGVHGVKIEALDALLQSKNLTRQARRIFQLFWLGFLSPDCTE